MSPNVFGGSDRDAQTAPSPQIASPTNDSTIPGSSGSLPAGSVLTPFSLLTAAQANNVLDNAAFTSVWSWSTLTTQKGLTLNGNAITNGTILAISSSSTGFLNSGSLASITLTGNNAANLGALLSLNTSGALSGAVPLQILNAGVGLSINCQGPVAWQSGADFSTDGVTNNAALANASLIRVVGGATGKTLTGIAGGSNGRILTLMNASNFLLTLTNEDAGSLAANRILTGYSSNLSVQPGGAITLQYDGSSNRWRVTEVEGAYSAGYFTLTAGPAQLPAGCLVLGVSAAAAWQLNLPAANSVGAGYQVTIFALVNLANAITVARSGGDTVNGAASVATSLPAATAAGKSTTLISDGNTGWYIGIAS